MHPILNRNQFFVKEHVGMFKAANNYDVYDINGEDMIMTCREEQLSGFTKLMRFTDWKTATPFHVEIKTTNGEMVCEIKRDWTFWRSKVEVFGNTGELVGYFRQRLWTIGGKFDLHDPQSNVLCTLKGKWHSWDFKFVKDNIEFAHVSKQWAGLAKELFTTADNYVLSIDEKVPANTDLRTLILAAVTTIDMVLKER